MAGGTWEFQNKKQPGIYINFKSSPTTLASVGERGTVAIAREMNWGDTGDIIEITSIADVYNKLGYDINSTEMQFAQQMFRGSNRSGGANKILVGRLATSGGVKATGTAGNLTAIPVVERYMRTFSFDLIYHEDRSKPNLYVDYMEMADRLDDKFAPPYLDYPITYTDSGGTEREGYTKLRVLNRNWKIDLNALHYMFEVQFLANRSVDEDPAKMLYIEDLKIIVKIYEGWWQ